MIVDKQLVQLRNNKEFSSSGKEKNLNSKISELPITEIPPDFIGISAQSYHESQQQVFVSKAVWANLHTLSEQIGITRHVILLTAFNLLLSRLLSQENIVTDLFIPSLNRPNLDLVTDHMAAKPILRIDLANPARFIELLKQVNKIISFEKSETALPIQNTLRNSSKPTIGFCILPDTKKESFFSDRDTKYDIKFCINPQPGHTSCLLTYNANLYTVAHMEEFLAQYNYLLEQLVSNPNKNILDYSLITPKAKEILPDPTKPVPSIWEKSVPETISEQAQRFPQAIAIVDDHNRWTYADLEVQSNKLAHYLIDSGIKEQDVVAVFAHRKASLVLALLGILKAGAAFMILDPAYPSHRLLKHLNQKKPFAFLHIDGAGTLPTELETYLEENSQIDYLHLSSSPTLSASSILENYAASPPNIQILPDSLAYIAFTSGSTGEPKGILGTHRPLTHFFSWHLETFNFTQVDRFSMLSGLAHDPILRDIFTPLCLGAALYIPDQDTLFDPIKLFEWLKHNEISAIHLTPSLSQIITANLTSENEFLPSLNHAFFGGEALTYNIVEDMYALAPNINCINFYGATETPQAMAYYPVEKPNSNRLRERIPLGHGIADVQLLVLNKNRALAGIYELGEIFVRTPYLSDGYLGDPKLTSERFWENPFTTYHGDLMYKTGDLGCYRPDGLITFSERADDQIKIRGFRIELAEIEHTVTQLPSIKDCLTVVREDIPNDKRIIAYYRSTKNISNEKLRDHTRAYLPSYMIPSTFIRLENYPRTPNGKVDKRALPAPNITNQPEYIPPHTTTEIQLASLWKELLNTDRVSLTDDFFILGGHSLIAVQLLVRIRKSFGVELNLSELFQESTLYGISKLIEAHQQGFHPTGITSNSLIRIHTPSHSSLPTLFCIHGGGGNILFLQEWGKYLEKYNLPLYGFQARGVDGISKPHNSIEEMANDYIQEMQEIQPGSPYYLVGYSGGGSVALEMAETLRKQGKDVPLVILLDSYHPSISGRRYRVEEHIQDVLQNPLSFVREKVKKRLDVVQSRMRNKHINGHINENRPIPLEMRDFYLGTHFSHLRQQYVTKSYTGNVALFRAKEIWRVYDHVDKDLGWRDSLHNLTIYEIPGDHDDLIREPNVGILIMQIVEVLSKFYP